MNDKKNIKAPEKFQEKLIEVMQGIYELFELSKEHNLEPVSEDGCVVYTEEYGKTCFQVSGQFDRPSEYLESLLDMIRVNYESCGLGSYFLNSNMGFLYDAIPKSPFQLGYISITSAPNTRFNSFWEQDVVPYIEKCGYSVADTASVFAVVSTGADNFSPEHLENVLSTLNAGSTSDELGAYLLSSVSQESAEHQVKLPTKQIHTGLCMDSGLDSKIRLSMWIINSVHASADH